MAIYGVSQPEKQELTNCGKEFGHCLLQPWDGMTGFILQNNPFFAGCKMDGSGPTGE